MLRVTTAGAPLVLVVLLVLMSVGQSVRSPDADRIVARYLDAMGGLDNLRSWKAMRASGRYVLVAEAGREVPFTVWYKAPDKTRVDIRMGDRVVTYAFDGRTAWSRNVAAGHAEPSPIPEEQARDIQNHADQYPFIDYRAKGHEIEIVGTGEFEGAPVHTIRLRRANGSESLHFFDARTGRELKIVTTSLRNGTTVTLETIERDFRRVDWLLLPFDVETRADGKTVRRMVCQAAEILPDLDDGVFSPPAAAMTGGATGGGPAEVTGRLASEARAEHAAMEQLDFVAGTWEGEGWIDVGGDGRRTFAVSETYRFRLGGLVLDGEGTFRPAASGGAADAGPRYGLGMIFFDPERGEYRMWHYGGSVPGHAFTVAVNVDRRARTLAYTATDPNGNPYRFGFWIDDNGLWVARTERSWAGGYLADAP